MPLGTPLERNRVGGEREGDVPDFEALKPVGRLAFVVDVDGVGGVELALRVVVDVDVHAVGDDAVAPEGELEVEVGLERRAAGGEHARGLAAVAALISRAFALGLDARAHVEAEVLTQIEQGAGLRAVGRGRLREHHSAPRVGAGALEVSTRTESTRGTGAVGARCCALASTASETETATSAATSRERAPILLGGVWIGHSARRPSCVVGSAGQRLWVLRGRKDLKLGAGRVELTGRDARYNPVQILKFRVPGAPRTSS